MTAILMQGDEAEAERAEQLFEFYSLVYSIRSAQ